MAALVEQNYAVVRAKDRECQRGILNCAEEDDRSNQKHGPVDEYFYPLICITSISLFSFGSRIVLTTSGFNP